MVKHSRPISINYIKSIRWLKLGIIFDLNYRFQRIVESGRDSLCFWGVEVQVKQTGFVTNLHIDTVRSLLNEELLLVMPTRTHGILAGNTNMN